jgi:16S rRNA (cytosine967-C5)-methyltransferase
MSHTDTLPPARHAALNCLQQVLDKGVDAQAALNLALPAIADPRDAALCTELCYGYLRHKGRLDFILSRFLSRPEGLPDLMHLCLGLAAHELLHLDKVPHYASVDWAVSNVSSCYGKTLGGLANAVLRRVAALGDEVHRLEWYGEPGEEKRVLLSRYYSLPLWILDMLLSAYDDSDLGPLLQALVQPPPTGVRINSTRSNAQETFSELMSKSHCRVSNFPALAFASGSAPPLETLEAQGVLSRQGFAAQEALLALNPDRWPEPVWDACAGRGGKTCLLLEKGIKVLASDTSRGRIRGLRKELSRLGIDAPCFLAKADAFPPLRTPPSTILLDVPCSGFGVLSRRPDIKWHRKSADLEHLIALQRRMLAAAWAALPSGGALVYLTCTFNPRENSEQIDWLLATEKDASLETQWSTPTDSPVGEFFWGALLRKQTRKKG